MAFQKRKSHRLQNYDYGQTGYYFITICTQNRQCILSDIDTVGSDALVAPLEPELEYTRVMPTPLGEKVLVSLQNMGKYNAGVRIDSFVLMHNHIHAMIVIEDAEPMELSEKQYGFEVTERRGRRSLQGLMRDFKSVTTRIYKKEFGGTTSLWQESFYDRVIRNQEEYETVWNYIDTNPLKWELDRYYIKQK